MYAWTPSLDTLTSLVVTVCLPTKLTPTYRFIAAERPPHLRAIAPWEGLSDYYREQQCRGGIPYTAFWDYRSHGYCGKRSKYLVFENPILKTRLIGKNGLEDTGTMIRKYPLMNEYWNDKRAQLARIEVPMYILASYSSCLHTDGSIRAFLFSGSKEKW